MSDYAIAHVVPFHRFEIQSPMDGDQVRSGLQAVSSSNWPWFGWPKDKEFIAKPSNKGLRLLPVIRGRNSYKPWVLLEITPAPNGGSILTGVMTVQPFDTLVMVVFFALALQLAMTLPQGRWMPIVFLSLFHLAMCRVGFIPEAKRSERRLRELLAAG